MQTLNTPERGVGVFVTINETDFKGRSKQTGKLITGALFSRVQLTSLQTAGPEPVVQWTALPSIMGSIFSTTRGTITTAGAKSAWAVP